MPENVESKRKKLQKQLDGISEKEKQLKARLRALDAKEKEAARKKETRAKIILGGFLVAHVKKGDQRFLELFDQAINEASERDKKVLNEYKVIFQS